MRTAQKMTHPRISQLLFSLFPCARERTKRAPESTDEKSDNTDRSVLPPPPIKIPPKSDATYSGDGISNQNLSLPKTVIFYLKESATPEILQKLHRTCKYFFASKPFPICHYFLVGPYSDVNVTVFYGNSVGIFAQKRFPINVILNHKIIISNTLQIFHERQGFLILGASWIQLLHLSGEICSQICFQIFYNAMQNLFVSSPRI